MRMKIKLTIIGFLVLSLTCQAQQTDVAREDTLKEVTVTSRSAQKRVEEVQIGVEKVDIATLAKMPSLFG